MYWDIVSSGVVIAVFAVIVTGGMVRELRRLILRADEVAAERYQCLLERLERLEHTKRDSSQ